VDETVVPAFGRWHERQIRLYGCSRQTPHLQREGSARVQEEAGRKLVQRPRVLLIRESAWLWRLVVSSAFVLWQP
jgi:hypothetical protein